MLFEEKTVLVTGGSSGIGRAAALAFAREGAQVLIADVNGEGGAETVHLIEQEGYSAQYITADVTSAAEVETMVDAIMQRFGSLDVAVNNAGIGGEMARVHEQDEAQFDLVMSVNVKGVWLCMKHEIPAMLRNGGGAIINVSSVAGLVGFNRGSIYSASKHAVIGLTKSAALEYASKGIRVNAISPSFVDTPMVSHMTTEYPQMGQSVQQASPMRRLGHAGEIAEAILWLASAKASFVNGAVLPLDGGLTAM